MISRFLLPLYLAYIDGVDWRVLHAFTYGSVTLARVIEVPANFITNFASIPRVFWSVYPPTGIYGKAALVHDYLYRTAYYATRAQADSVFLEAMEDLGVGWWTRQLLYRGVRIGGRRSYGGYAAVRNVSLHEVDLFTRGPDNRPR